MIAEQNKKYKLIMNMHLMLDITITITAFIVSYFLKKYLLPDSYRGLSEEINYYIIVSLIIAIWLIIFYLYDPYSTFMRKTYVELLTDLVKILTVGMIILITCLFLLKIKDVSRMLLVMFYFLDLAFLAGSKCLLRYILVKKEESEQNIYNILIIGSKNRATSFIELINSAKNGYNIVGCLEIDPGKIGKEVKDGVKIVGTIADLRRILITNVIDEVVFAMPLNKIESVDEYMFLIEVLGIKVRIIPDWLIHSIAYQPGIASTCFEYFHGMPTMTLCSTSSKHSDLLLKVIMDYFVAGAVTLMFLPLMLMIAGAIRLFSKGPVLFKQERVGLYGRKFQICKYRTMVMNAEELQKDLMVLNEADGPAFKIARDPRIIPYIGTFLRKTSLDELPQLLNVLKGEMSLVGPRPPLPSEVEKYNLWYRRRLSMKPGLTCLWQIRPNRNDLSFVQWMELDLEYIDNWSLSLDLSILFKTALVVFAGHGR